mgnify:CR=1 FL=1
MGENGPIQLLTSDFTVESDGNIYDATGELVDRLLITIPPEGAELVRAAHRKEAVPHQGEVQFGPPL